MEQIQELLLKIAKMQWSDYLDIFIVAFLIYKTLPLLKSTGAMRVVRVVLLMVAVGVLTELMHLYTLNFLFKQVLSIGLIAIVVLFQPELRRVVDHVSSLKMKRFFGIENDLPEMETIISQTALACDVMSRQKIGALIVFARDVHTEEYMKTGTAVDGQVSEQLLRNIFFPKAALHDGAVIIRDGRIAAAGCVLPLSESHSISADLGTRHRAGLGMSEMTDAVVVIVSEETGAISLAVGGMLKRGLTAQTLERMLAKELLNQQETKSADPMEKLRKRLQRKEAGSHDEE